MRILDVKIDNVSTDEILKKVPIFLGDGFQHYIVTPNPEMLVLAQKNRDFREILNKADMAIADGIGIIFASLLFGKKIKRIHGVDLMAKILAMAENRIFLLGGRSVAEKIAKDYPAVIGFSEELENATAQINKLQPNILFVALGAPRQENWIAENLAKIPSVRIAMGVGGAFDLLSGKIKRAPKFMRKIGLEWLWRLILEPKRLSRIYRAVIVFPFLAVKNFIVNFLSSEK
ncbi:MAG: WecB/TagA/CpsF family glycosyltransferase [Candidatus Portnoybacteria bacterium]|nr:WecB/TagA/CpsF family glycosyltransferase [Candidatus Portnoybacteria bacterium]